MKRLLAIAALAALVTGCAAPHAMRGHAGMQGCGMHAGGGAEMHQQMHQQMHGQMGAGTSHAEHHAAMHGQGQAMPGSMGGMGGKCPMEGAAGMGGMQRPMAPPAATGR
jgi:hypothetical protein